MSGPSSASFGERDKGKGTRGGGPDGCARLTRTAREELFGVRSWEDGEPWHVHPAGEYGWEGRRVDARVCVCVHVFVRLIVSLVTLALTQ